MDRCKVGFYLATHGLPPTVFSKQYIDLPPTFFAEAAHESHPADRRGSWPIARQQQVFT